MKTPEKDINSVNCPSISFQTHGKGAEAEGERERERKMAGALAVRGGSSDDDLIASHSPSVTLKYRWEVAFSRFFNFPRIRSSSVDLRPLPLCKTRCKGTWVSSSSSPSLCLVPEPEPMLFVSMQGKILVSLYKHSLTTHHSPILFLSLLIVSSCRQSLSLVFSLHCIMLLQGTSIPRVFFFYHFDIRAGNKDVFSTFI